MNNLGTSSLNHDFDFKPRKLVISTTLPPCNYEEQVQVSILTQKPSRIKIIHYRGSSETVISRIYSKAVFVCLNKALNKRKKHLRVTVDLQIFYITACLGSLDIMDS